MDFVSAVKSRQIVLPNGTVRMMKKTAAGDREEQQKKKKKKKRHRRGKKQTKQGDVNGTERGCTERGGDVFDFLNNNHSIASAGVGSGMGSGTAPGSQASNSLIDPSSAGSGVHVRKKSVAGGGAPEKPQSQKKDSLGVLSLGSGEEKLIQRMVSNVSV